MPLAVNRKSSIVKSYNNPIHHSPFTIYWRQRRQGFTLIEIVLSLFLILAILTIFFTAASTYTTSRRSNLQDVATKIASCEIEQLRKATFSSIVNVGSTDITAPCNQDVSRLPSGQAKKTISDYQGSTKIKQIAVQVTWITNQAPQKIDMDSLIYEYGL